MFVDCKRFWKLKDEKSIDICVIGSSQGKYAFDFSGIENISGENWAIDGEPIEYDLKIIKNYCRYMKPGGTVVITLSPFTACFTPRLLGCANRDAEYRYYMILQPKDIHDYNPEKAEAIRRFNHENCVDIQNVPVAKHVTPGDYQNLFAENAKNFVEVWSKLFHITDFSAPISEYHRRMRIGIAICVGNIIDFCIEKGLIPIMYLCPMTEYMIPYFTSESHRNYIQGLIDEISRKKIPVFNDWSHPKFSKAQYFFNSIWMNSSGSKSFTRAFLKERLNLPDVKGEV